MIQLAQEIYDGIIAHAQAELPNECCGYLAGTDSTINKQYRMSNIDHSPEHFSFDPQEQFNVVRDARNKQLKILANYHSHPETPARPSDEDIKLAFDPNIIYFIVSMAAEKPVLKAFKIVAKEVTNVNIAII